MLKMQGCPGKEAESAEPSPAPTLEVPKWAKRGVASYRNQAVQEQLGKNIVGPKGENTVWWESISLDSSSAAPPLPDPRAQTATTERVAAGDYGCLYSVRR